MERQILAEYDEEGIFVYQAFKPEIVEDAVAKGRFGKGFGIERMTWIKPSFAWILYRSGYATKHNQERIVKVKIPHAAWHQILSGAVLSKHDTDLYPDSYDWKVALDRSEAVVQWDPERDVWLRPLEERAIQVGIRSALIRLYAYDWPLSITDVTPLARAIAEAKQLGTALCPWSGQRIHAYQPFLMEPQVRVYPVPSEIQQRLKICDGM